MKSTDTNCRTCGAEYRNNPIVLIVIILLVLGVVLFAGFSFSLKKESEPNTEQAKSESPKKSTPTNWAMEDRTDKMTDKKNSYLFNRAVNAETGISTDAGITIGCSYHGGLNGVFASDMPIKTENFTKDGAVGEYSIRFDDKPMEEERSNLSSLNKVIVLSDIHTQQIEDSSKVLIRITTGMGGYKTFEINTSGGADLFARMKEFCLLKTKESKAP